MKYSRFSEWSEKKKINKTQWQMLSFQFSAIFISSEIA